jgi:DNA-binding NtrC family response regulator
MGHQEDFFSAVHRPNGKSNGVDFDYAHLGAGRADRPEHFSDSLAAQAGGLPDYDDIDDVDDVPVAGTVKSNGAEMDVKTFKNGEQLSTLAQVEELSKEFERRTILAALQRSTWNRKRAAKMLDIDYKGLLYKMKKLEIA